jgi:hypothetical protein
MGFIPALAKTSAANIPAGPKPTITGLLSVFTFGIEYVKYSAEETLSPPFFMKNLHR